MENFNYFLFSDRKKDILICKLCQMYVEKSMFDERYEFKHQCNFYRKRFKHPLNSFRKESKRNVMIKDGEMFHLCSKNQKV